MFNFTSIFYKVSETKLTVTIKHEKPIELLDFTTSFLSLGQEYKRHSVINYNSDSKLYVKEIRKGSTIIELIEITKTSVLPFLGDVNTVVEFTKFIKHAYDYFLKKEDVNKPKYSEADLINLKKILEPVVNNDSSTTIVFNTTINGNVQLDFGTNFTEANAIQNAITKEIKRLNETTPTFQEKVAFYWYATKNDLKSQSWERGVIESIYKHPVKVVFDSEDIKKKMIHPPVGNIFDLVFVVDVKIETVDGGRPILYKITDFYDYISKDDSIGEQTEMEF